MNYKEYKEQRKLFLRTMNNIPEKELDYIVAKITISVERDLPQYMYVEINNRDTPFFWEKHNELKPEYIEKILNKKLKPLGWHSYKISFNTFISELNMNFYIESRGLF